MFRSFDPDKQLEKQQIFCNALTVKGQFVFGGSSPMLQSLLGGSSVNGNGKAKIKLGMYLFFFFLSSALLFGIKHSNFLMAQIIPSSDIIYV